MNKSARIIEPQRAVRCWRWLEVLFLWLALYVFTRTGSAYASFFVKSTAPNETSPASRSAQSTATPAPIGLSLANPVTANAQWTPVIQDFDGVAMALVPTGCLTMASPHDMQPQCFNTPFWIDVFEVTNAQFAQFDGVAASESHWTELLRPRERITGDEARDFCENKRPGDVRLPNEIEWEYAAAGPDGLVFPWGNELVTANAVYGAHADGETADVGSRPDGASWVGALDLVGNVWEWVIPVATPNTGNEVNYVLRGGAWSVSDGGVRIASRLQDAPHVGVDSFGFRCARDSDVR